MVTLGVRRLYLTYCCLLVTHDNTHPGDIFKARILHSEQRAGRQPRKKGAVGEIQWKDQTDNLPKTCRLVSESCSLRSNGA